MTASKRTRLSLDEDLPALIDDQGRLERRFPLETLQVPAFLDVDGDRLVYQLDVPGKEPVLRRPGKGMLRAFLFLADDQDGSPILAYARKWGVLEVCEHDLVIHTRGCRPRRMDGSTEPPHSWEPLSLWRRLAGEAYAIGKIADHLHQGESVPASLWQRAFPLWPPGYDPKEKHQRTYLSMVITAWVGRAHVQPIFGWKETIPEISFGGGGLLGALASQLMLAIRSRQDLRFCRGWNCSIPFEVLEPHELYCEKCRKAKVPQKQASARRRDKTRKRRT